jgi:hypothetical protein
MGSRMVYLPAGNPAANLSGIVYTSPSGTVLADILAFQPGNPDVPGAPILGSVVTTNEYGLLPYFWFPENVDRVWISVNGGPPTPIDADYNARLDKLDGNRVYNVRGYGAKGDGVADDTTAILAAVADAQSTKGTVYFPGGIYRVSQTIPIHSDVDYAGSGVGATTVRLADGANVDLAKTDQFDALFAGNTQAGPSHWSIRQMTLDGNGAQQTGTSWVLSTYGRCFRVDQVEIVGGASGGWRSKWATGGDEMESLVTNFKIHDNGGDGLDWQGPHDSHFVNGYVFRQDGHIGIWTHGNAGGERFSNVHVWHFHAVGWQIEATATAMNCVGEGADVNVWLLSNGCIWDGEVFGTAGTGPAGTEVGVRVGASDNTKWGCRVRGTSWNWAADDIPLDLAGDNGNDIDLTVRAGAATAMYAGQPSPKTRLNINVVDQPQLAQTEKTTLLRALGYADNAIETGPRFVDTGYTAVSGRINLSYVTAYRTQTITQLGSMCRATAVGTLTAVRWGLYEVASNGDLTLVARTAQLTSGVYTATFTEYTSPLATAGGFPASYTLIEGRRYALAQIVTFSGTAPQLKGYAGNAAATLNGRAPRISGLVGAQTDLLTSITAGSVVNDGNAVFLFGLA